MILALALLQAAAPALPPPVELVPVAAASLVTRVTFDASGAVTGCTTDASGVAGAIDGCALFGRADAIGRLAGRPTAGLASAAVRLDAVPEGQAAPAAPPGLTRRTLGAAVVDVTPAGAIGTCDGAAGQPLDLCKLLPAGAAAFAPDATGRVRRLRLSFAIDVRPR